MRYIGIFQIMEPSNLLKPCFETSVTFEMFGFLCGFHCCAQETELYHFIYVFIYFGVSLTLYGKVCLRLKTRILFQTKHNLTTHTLVSKDCDNYQCCRGRAVYSMFFYRFRAVLPSTFMPVYI